MLKGDVLLGAEESGGIGFPGHIPERDGIAAGLMLLEMLATEKVSVNKLLAKLENNLARIVTAALTRISRWRNAPR